MILVDLSVMPVLLIPFVPNVKEIEMETFVNALLINSLNLKEKKKLLIVLIAP